MPYIFARVILPPHTVARTRSFDSSVAGLLTDGEIDRLIDAVARNPDIGDVIPGTRGLRKVRWQASGRGKRGGARVIYYVRDERMPVFLLYAYAKNEQDDLSAREKKELAAAVQRLVASYRRP